ncbi:hypothetical protein RIF29_17401 [Crotalaria pallida]|uniref:Protein kinase domain-containing protein n=1 Tax=Crotalaria pallida TaxID=3830 RepID=A0AAN9ICX6_CROPI
MGFSQGTCTIDTAPQASSAVAQNSSNYKLTFKTFLRKIIWEFSLACVAASCHGKGLRKITMEHNKVLLMAESGASDDPQSVESSFRFSFGSQAELESMNMNSSAAAATVLMVNLGYESIARELRWRRMESLENRISHVAKNLIRFNYDQILYATHNFSKDRVLGRGALSCVFKGRVGLLRTAVAIKRLNMEDKECGKAFCRELVIASSLQNPNIVPLVGFCVDSEEGLFLVYKYVSGGSLEHHLHGWKKSAKGCSSLPWSVRYKVAIGIAEAVAYLHNGTERCVVHRDIKPSNILLSSKKIPMLCDFGLATWTSAPSVPFLCKAAKGTFGYLAPEYFQHGKVSDKTDVYAFGVVLLELITGRKPIEVKGYPGEENLLLWAKPLLQKGKGAIEELLDPQLERSSRSSKQIVRMIQAAAACVTNEESSRPSMHEIIAILKGEVEPVFSRRKKSGYLGNGCAVIDCNPQPRQTNNEMKSHLALAMLGVLEFEDVAYLFGR